jgi:RNA polymerase sigma factor (sigma-70 family)
MGSGPAVDDPADVVLIDRFMNGDERAFRVLYGRHSPRLRMLLLRIVGYREVDADDLLQESWLACCRAIHTFRAESKFSTWLTTIAIRLARHRLTLHDPLHWDAEEIEAAEHSDPSASIDVERALALLPDRSRAVLVLHDIEGWTHDEIGRQLGIATGTSKATLSRARAFLRRHLTDLSEVVHER